jgi:hypothetical protein
MVDTPNFSKSGRLPSQGDAADNTRKYLKYKSTGGRDECDQDLVLQVVTAIGEGPEAGSDALMGAILGSSSSNTKVQRQTVSLLTAILKSVLLRGPGMLQKLLQTCREETLGRALSNRGQKDRKPIRAVLSTLLSELTESHGTLDEISASDIISSTDNPLAMEILLLKQSFSSDDCIAVQDLWQKQYEHRGKGGNFTSEVTNVVQGQIKKKQGGMKVAEWAWQLRWVCGMHKAVPTWLEMVDQLLSQVKDAGCSAKLLEASRSRLNVLQCEVVKRLRSDALCEVTRQSQKESLDVKPMKSKGAIKTEPLPQYELSSTPEWVSDEDEKGSVAKVHSALEKMISDLHPDERLLVGLDTEWGSDRRASVIQLSTVNGAWVLDSKPSEALKSLIVWIFTCPRILVLGFAFHHDINKLEEMLRSNVGGKPTVYVHDMNWSHLDVQTVAMAYTSGHSGSPNHSRQQMPGLKNVAEVWLGRTLDKKEQRSDWDVRPLSSDQMRYAATDAVVLLDIVAAMGITGTFKNEIVSSATRMN